MIQIPNDFCGLLANTGEALRDSMRTIAVAELGTGGLLGYLLSSEPASAAVFSRGFICGDQRALLEEISVQRWTLDHYGVLSEAVAKEMARGARFNSDCTYGIALVANAGPATVEGVKPGMVWVAISHGTTFSVSHHEIKGTPHEVRWQTVQSALILLAEAIRYF
jgi:PncC family amidohydrolase